ncbi:MAG: PilZ domain-containing protein [Phycisphaerae bacterium]|nr:PilZ domain-containing protein [Phycisphaerae bacterium]
MPMQALLDLTPAQFKRVLEQAVRSRAVCEFDARPFGFQGKTLSGTIEARDNGVLRVRMRQMPDAPESLLIGAFCDVQMQLSGELYCFSTCVIDLPNTGANDVFIATPQAMQIANRRRFARRSPAEAVLVQLWPAGAESPYHAALVDVDPHGLAVRGHRGDLDELLLIGDTIRLQLELPQVSDSFELPAIICNKKLDVDREHMLIGFEFEAIAPEASQTLERLRTCLTDPAAGFIDLEDRA